MPHTTEPLNFPLNFTHTAKANAKTNASLLREGEYDAIEKRVYEQYQRCHGCGTDEKALTLIVIRDRLTRETFEIGRKCMEDLYGVNIVIFDTHASQVRNTRLRLARKLGLTGSLSGERQLAIVREAVVTYVPVPERLLQELDLANPWDLRPAETDRIRDLHQLACYHREWQEDPEHARRRWTALGGHPAFAYTGDRDAAHQKCRRALASGQNLPEREIIVLNTYLRKAAAFEHRWPRLVAPEDHPDREAYVQALHAALEVRVQRGAPVDHSLTGVGETQRFRPLDHVGLDVRRLYAVVAVWDTDAGGCASVIHGTDPYWKKTRKPLIARGPVDHREISAVTYTRRNDLNELEEVTREPAWTFQFRRVAWALVEPYTETYPLWRVYGRNRLERYL